jgi:signal transduction histidine kinase
LFSGVELRRRPYALFFLVLAIYLVIVNGVLLSQQKAYLLSHEREHIEIEMNLISYFASEALIKGDYSSVESFINRWGKERDEIVEIKAQIDNDFILGQYKGHADMTSSYTSSVRYGQGRSVIVETVLDSSELHHSLDVFMYQLIAGSVFLVMLLGYSLKKLSIEPLRKEVGERRLAEQVLKQRTADLAAVNKELETYSYTIAHDLRAPIRAIISFSQILKEDAGDRLDKDEIDSLDRIVNGGKRMSELIGDLLELSRITRSEINYRPLDLNKLASEIAQRLSAEDPERQVEWVIQPNLKVYGDKGMLDIVLTNLMENAWKYTSKNDEARIEVSGKNVDGRFIVSVQDNGVGFDQRYSDKLFVPFQRLHSDKLFPGTGIGLATVQRIVSRHNGQVWAESEENKGSIFYFTLEN